MNVELAERIIAEILMEPQRLKMDDWFVVAHETFDTTVGSLRQCGTAGCIAGHAIFLTQPDSLAVKGGYEVEYPDGVRLRIEDLATSLLELNSVTASLLFHMPHDDEAVPALKYLIGNPSASAEDLRDFIKEGRDNG